MFDLARFAWWDPQMLADLLDGYGRDALSDDDWNLRMPGYLVANAVVGAARDIRRSSGRGRERARSFIRTARSRDFAALASGGPGAGAGDVVPASPAEEQRQMLIDAVHGRTDEQIGDFAAMVGGYGQLCALVFNGWRALLQPGDYVVAFALGGDNMKWVISGASAKVTVARKRPASGAVAHMSPQDFLRLVVGDIDTAAALGDGRLKIEGDAEHLVRLFASR